MKKLLITAIAALAMASTAQAEWYVQGNVGYGKVKSSTLDDGHQFSDSKFIPSAAVGYKFGYMRLALDYTNYGSVTDSYKYQEQNSKVESSDKVKIYGLGVSAIYDFDIDSLIKPYAGVRVAMNKIKLTGNSTETKQNEIERDSYSESSNKFGYGAVVGATYDLTNVMPNLAADVAAEYNALGKVDDANFKQYGVKVGLKYSF